MPTPIINMAIKSPIMHRIVHLAVLTIVVLAPDRAAAASLANCLSQYQNLDSSIPEGGDETWAKIIGGELDAINALNDEDSVFEAQLKIANELNAYQENPDPDGDGYAMAPQVFEAHTDLLYCLTAARYNEVKDAGEDESRQAEPGAVQAASEQDLSSPPTPIDNSGSWFTEASYPPRAAREERQGAVSYDLTIGADGSVLGCQASGPPGNADLEMATCDAILTRARFNPAADAAGKPVGGEYSGTVHWRIPE